MKIYAMLVVLLCSFALGEDIKTSGIKTNVVDPTFTPTPCVPPAGDTNWYYRQVIVKTGVITSWENCYMTIRLPDGSVARLFASDMGGQNTSFAVNKTVDVSYDPVTLQLGYVKFKTGDYLYVSGAAPTPTPPIQVSVDTGWNWVSTNPAPFSGNLALQSNIVPGLNQYSFTGATTGLAINSGDHLTAYVYIDPVNKPSEIMLQWNDGNWEHRAYWGDNNIGLGTDGSNSRRYIGPLPTAGQWVRLAVPASSVGLEGRTLNGMAFTLFGGRATWDRAGKFAPTVTYDFARFDILGLTINQQDDILTSAGENGYGTCWVFVQTRYFYCLRPKTWTVKYEWKRWAFPNGQPLRDAQATQVGAEGYSNVMVLGGQLRASRPKSP